ncbi:MAG: hypothetical protein VXZ82_18395 [Planctomycetota bacterium]|nr:hypothetical protein [Planctomycetota bacterium]
MDSLSNLFEQTRSRYASMPASTRLLAVLLLAVVVASSCWMLSVYDLQAQTELLSHLSQTEMRTATTCLESAGLTNFKITNQSCLCVPSSEKAKYAEVLQQANAMPSATRDQRELDGMSIFVPPSVQEQQTELRHEQAFEEVLKRRQQIGFASVEYSEAESTGFGPKQRSCCIQVESPDKRPIDRFVLATIRETAVSYFAGLKTQDVRVIDLNASHTAEAVLNPEDQRLLQAKHAWEEHYHAKVSELLASYGPVKIFVDVQLDPLLSKHTESRKLLASPQPQEDVTIARRVEVTRPKQRISIESTAPLKNKVLPAIETVTTKRHHFGHEEKVESKQGLNPKSLHLSVEIPESHYRELYRQQLQQNQMPTTELALNLPTIAELADIQREVERRVEASLQGLTQHQLDLQVSIQVQSYLDQAPPEFQPPTTAQLAGFWLLQNQQTLFLGGLALVILLFMGKWIRNSRPMQSRADQTVALNTHDNTSEKTIGKGELVAGEAVQAEPANQAAMPQLKSSLSKLVTDNPENTKAVLNRWLNDAA